MEEKSPTMPSVVFLKYVKVTGIGSDSQGEFEYAEGRDVACGEGVDSEELHGEGACLEGERGFAPKGDAVVELGLQPVAGFDHFARHFTVACLGGVHERV